MSDDARPETDAEREHHLAEARKADAEAHKARAEARKLAAEADKAAHEAEKSRIERDKAVREERDALAADKHHHRYVFDSDVSASSVNSCIKQLQQWSRNDEAGCDIELVLNSPGGGVIEGFALIDFLTTLQASGHKVTTHALGMAASMAGVILQAGDTRVMGRNSVLLIHEASFGAVGSYGEVQDRVKLVDIMHERILDLFATRAKVSKAFIKKNWNRRDWWISAPDALKYGFVDEVR